MKKGLLILIGILIVLGIGYVSINNSIVTKEESVTSQWGNVQTAYQKRLDLVSNLVNTVKGAAGFEQETLNGVIEARSKATSMNLNANNLTAENLKQFEQVQDGLSGALNRLMVVVERYPELKATQNFASLQVELSSIENEIRFERKKFNDNAQDYNSYIKRIPYNFVAGIKGSEEKEYFQSQEGAEVAPTVNFD